MERMQLDFERSKLGLTYKNGIYGPAMVHFETNFKGEGKFPLDLQYTWGCATEEYASYTLMQCGSAIIATSFIINLFGGEKKSLEQLKNIAKEGGYENFTDRFDGTKESWFDDLEKNLQICSSRVWDCKTIPIGLQRADKLVAYVMRVRDNNFYVVSQKEETYHYVVLLGVKGDKACVFDAGFGVKQHLSLHDLIHSAEKVWRVERAY